MKRLIIASMLVGILSGCSNDFPFKWRPTEQQKQAADLAVKDIAALAPHVAQVAEPIRREAQASAETTQTYIGLPKQRPQPVSPANDQIIRQAATDAARPAPTTGQVGGAIVAQAEQITTTGFDLAELLLTAAGSVAGVWGLGKVKRRVDGFKTRANEAEGRVGETLQAIREIVRGVDQLDPETKTKVKAAQLQSLQTERIVADAKRS